MPDTPSPTPKRSGLPKWLKITIIVALVCANIAVLGFIWVVKTGNDLLSGASTLDESVSDVLDPTTGEALTFLIVGSDSRAGLDDLDGFGDFSGARSDVVMMVRVDRVTNTARMLSLPRDLWVSIPGNGENRINAAYAFGGASLLIETIKENLDVEINHYVEIDFVGFQALVDELGGIEIEFDYPARDSKSGLDVDAGLQTLDGEQALAYARSRHYQELQGGSWVSVKASDIGRTERQQEVIKAILSELKSPASIAEAGDIASAMSQHMSIDSKLADSSVSSMVWDFKGILTGSTEGSTLPTSGASIGGRSVQVAKEPEASEMLAEFRSGAATTETPLRLAVLNGNGAAGAAGDMSDRLESLGFTVASVGNSGSNEYEQTTVVVPEGSDQGDVVVAALGFGVVEFGSVDNNVDAVVIVGSDAS